MARKFDTLTYNINQLVGEQYDGIHVHARNSKTGYMVNRFFCKCGHNGVIPASADCCPVCGKSFLDANGKTNFLHFELNEDKTVVTIKYRTITPILDKVNDIFIDFDVSDEDVCTFEKMMDGNIVISHMEYKEFRLLSEGQYMDFSESMQEFFGEYCNVFQNSQQLFGAKNSFYFDRFAKFVLFVNKAVWADMDWCYCNNKMIFSILQSITNENIENMTSVTVEDFLENNGFMPKYIPMNTVRSRFFKPHLIREEVMADFASSKLGQIINSRFENSQIDWNCYCGYIDVYHSIYDAIRGIGDGYIGDDYGRTHNRLSNLANAEFFEDFCIERLDVEIRPYYLRNDFIIACNFLEEHGVLVTSDSLRIKEYHKTYNSSKVVLKKTMDIEETIQKDPIALWTNLNATKMAQE